MKLFALFLVVIFALANYAPTAESKKVTVYDALRPILKTKAKKHVKSLVKDDRLAWGVGLTNEQKAQIMDMLAGKKSANRQSPEEPCEQPACITSTALHDHIHLAHHPLTVSLCHASVHPYPCPEISCIG